MRKGPLTSAQHSFLLDLRHFFCTRHTPQQGITMTSPQPHSQQEQEHFRVLEESAGIQVEEGSGNAFHLGPILRKYTPARITVKGARRYTTVEMPLLFDALGLLRSLQYDVAQFNSVSPRPDRTHTQHTQPTASEIRYACYRLTRQAAAFGVRLPRPGTTTVEVPGLDQLVELVESHFAEQIAAARAMIAGGVVDFPSVAELFRPGVDLLDRGLATGIFGVPTAMRVRGGYFSRGKSLFGIVSTFFAAIEFVVAAGGDKFAVVEASFPVSEYQGTRSTTEGLDNFVVLSETLKGQLLQRGQLYSQLATSGAFLEYAAGSFLPVARTGATTRTPTRSRGAGRIMIDSQAAWHRGVHCARSEGVASDAVKGVLKLMAQRTRMSAGSVNFGGGLSASESAGGQQAASAAEEESLELLLLSSPLPESLTWLTWPVVAGFSFHAKSWGVVLVSGLREVRFNEEAFARLVLPDARKKLIEALVLSHRGEGGSSSTRARATHTDVIAGKGEGTIFLLHGPPGVGKTLTAEAIAELLHKPLYVVSMGELGTTPEALEERLLDILDLCTPWGALVLIDEAEMLLERRTKDDIVRNAMVCVMLRLLEYYCGILFLTTNRVESLDPAFQSRVQCALRYDELDVDSRTKIWKDLLDHSSVEKTEGGLEVNELAKHKLNGRQIKNALQLAVALAQNEGAPLSMKHLEATLDITTAFVSQTSGW